MAIFDIEHFGAIRPNKLPTSLPQLIERASDTASAAVFEHQSL
jgi:hypothetical protein